MNFPYFDYMKIEITEHRRVQSKIENNDMFELKINYAF